MELINSLLEFLRHPDVVLETFLRTQGTFSTYAFLFGIVFVETGLIIMPFLPGDSLLFAVGAVATNAKLSQYISLGVLYPLFITAALLGDNVNYWVGRNFGRKLFASDTSKIFNRAYLRKTEEFFERHGGRAVILARFVPIVRTFAPFVAGMGSMSYPRFLAFSVAGAILWVGICVTLGACLGSLEFIKHNFEKMVLVIIAVSLVPMVIEFVKHRQEAKKRRAEAEVIPGPVVEPPATE